MSLANLMKSTRKASDLADVDHLKIMISGASGAGKTTLAARFRRPLVISTETKGLERIKEENPNAVVWCSDESGPPGVRNLDDLRKALGQCIAAGPDLATEFDAVVLDSLNEAQGLIKASFEREKRGLIDMQTWGHIIDTTARVVRTLRDLPTNVLVIVIDEEREDGNRVLHRPALNGKKLPNQLAQHFSICGFAHRRRLSTGHTRHQVLFDSDDSYITKPVPALDTIEPPEPLYWLHKRFGTDLPADVAERVAAWKALDEDDKTEK